MEVSGTVKFLISMLALCPGPSFGNNSNDEVSPPLDDVTDAGASEVDVTSSYDGMNMTTTDSGADRVTVASVLLSSYGLFYICS